jgi:hypothetical protein
MPNYLAPINLSQNELRNAAIQNLPSAPANPVAGQIYFDTTVNVLFFWNGTVWVETDGRTAIPEGPAGGDLTGNYPNPELAPEVVGTPELGAGAVTGAKVSSTIKDAAAGTPSLRTLGTGPQQATAGNDSRLSDQRIPVDGSVDDSKVAANARIKISKLELDPTDRANHHGTQLAQTISDFDQQVRTNRLDQLAKPQTDVDLNGQHLIGLADPVSPQDAATKAYVDATAQGLDPKQSVRVATTGNVTLSGLQTIDGVNLADGDAILVKDQSTASTNGIYVVHTGAWTRRTDADSSAKVTPGLFTFVEEGQANRDNGFVLATDGAVSLGTTALSFVQFSGAGQVDAGSGLTKSGNRLDVNGTTGRISVGPDSIDIDAAYVGQTSITTLGTITTGTWQGSTVDVAHGGTGATTPLQARTNLGATTKYAATLAGGATSEVVTHNLNTQDATVTLRQVAAPYAVVEADIEFTSVNTITVRAANPLPADTYRIVITG